MSRTPFLYRNPLTLIPVFDTKTADLFMAEGSLVRDAKVLEGVHFETAPLKFDKNIDLLGLSMHPELLQKGQQDMTDVILPHVQLREVYIRPADVGPVIRIADMHLNDSIFERPSEGNERSRRLRMRIEYIETWGNYRLTWVLAIGGEVSLELCNIRLAATACLSSVQAFNNAPELSAEEKKIVEEQRKPQMLGYSLGAYRGNANHRSNVSF